MSNAVKYDLVGYIGRFNPFHNGHRRSLELALERSERVLVLIGSSNVATDVRNPFSFRVREQMILSAAEEAGLDIKRIKCEPLDDIPYNDNAWVKQVQRLINRNSYKTDNKVALIGFKRDHTSYYLDLFPQYEYLAADELLVNFKPIAATDIRSDIFEHDYIDKDLVPLAVRKIIRKEIEENPVWFKNLVKEYKHIHDYKRAWATAPYAPTFVTVDAVVVQSGHVLIVTRKAEPGKGMIALPGGFVNQLETLEDAMLRELKEETNIKVPVPVLRGSIKASKVFDAPGRSLRGRTITHAYHIELPPGPLPRVRGGDDASSSGWITLEDFMNQERNTFEDHNAIVRHFVGL